MGGACIQNSDSVESGQGQTINSYTNKPINKFKVRALLDDTLSCTHRVRVGLDYVTISMGWALDIFTLVPSSVIQQYFVMNHCLRGYDKNTNFSGY